MGTNPSFYNGIRGGLDYGVDLNRPVDSVTWDNANIFCIELSRLEKRNFRLPTEAEWEYCCRAGTESQFWFGDAFECNLQHAKEVCVGLEEYIWPYLSIKNTTMPVAQKLPNPWGIYDMHGNVGEWCLDWLDEYPLFPVVDPFGPNKTPEEYKVIRGNGIYYCGYRSAARSGAPIKCKDGTICVFKSFEFQGLRIVDCRKEFYPKTK